MQGLVADTNPVTQRVLANLLIYCGHSAAAFAGNPAATWRFVQDMEPDFVLVDWDIISHDNFRLLRKAGSSRVLARIPFLIMVPGLDPNLLAEAAEHGGRDYLPKPIPASLLNEKILQATSMARENMAETLDREAKTTAQNAAARAREQYFKGREHILNRDFQRAAQAFQVAIDAVRTFPEAHKGLAISCRGLGNAAQAVEHMERAAECYILTRRPDKAVKLLQESRRTGLPLRNPFALAGERLLEEGDMDAARGHLEEAYRLTPTDEHTVRTLSRALMDAGEDSRVLSILVPWLERESPPAWALEFRDSLPDPNGPHGQVFTETDTIGEEGHGPPKVLIIDDEPHIRLLLEQSLESLEDDGVSLLFAEDGEKGLDMIRTERPDLVFLDVMMPRMNGFEVCETVKHALSMEDTYVIMLTAKGQEFDRKRGMEAGADVYMTKPFRPVEVLNLARAVLDLD